MKHFPIQTLNINAKIQQKYIQNLNLSISAGVPIQMLNPQRPLSNSPSKP